MYTPSDWSNLIAKCKTRNPFIVYEMKNIDFKDPVFMKKWIVNRKKDSSGEKVSWLNIKWMRFEKDTPFTMYNKKTLQKDFDFNEVSMARFKPTRRRPNPIIGDICELPELYSSSRAIHPKTYEYILELLDYVPPIHHLFYKNLDTDESAPLQHPDDAGLQDETDVDDDVNSQEIDF